MWELFEKFVDLAWNDSAASQKYTDITLSDLAAINIATLKELVAEASCCHRVHNFEIRCKSGKYKVTVERAYISLLSSLRSAVKLVVPCNLHKEIPLLNINRQYDAVQCTFTLDSVARGHSLKGIIQNMGNHLKPGGALVMLNVLGATYWTVGPYKYPKFALAPGALEDALTDAGFEDIELNIIPIIRNRQLPCGLTSFVTSCAFKKR